MGNSKSKKKKATVYILPQPFTSEDDFFKNWLTWKEQFDTYITATKVDKTKLAAFLLNRIGPVGQAIYKRSSTINSCDEQNFDELVYKLNFCYIFGDRKRQNNENIDTYIQNLKKHIQEKRIANVEVWLRRKILADIDVDRFTKAAQTLMPSFTHSVDRHVLVLNELIYIWKLSETTNYSDSCGKYGERHGQNVCPASGHRCRTCDEPNHFAKQCKRQLIIDCIYCGSSHQRQQCPAYGVQCKWCHNLNHFSWKCCVPKVFNCIYCGSSHAKIRTMCLALNSKCHRCKRTGHYGHKCLSKRR